MDADMILCKDPLSGEFFMIPKKSLEDIQKEINDYFKRELEKQEERYLDPSYVFSKFIGM